VARAGARERVPVLRRRKNLNTNGGGMRRNVFRLFLDGQIRKYTHRGLNIAGRACGARGMQYTAARRRDLRIALINAALINISFFNTNPRCGTGNHSEEK